MQANKRKTYSEETKKQLFTLIEAGNSIAAAAKQLDIHINTARLWTMKRNAAKEAEYNIRKNNKAFDKTDLKEMAALARKQKEYINHLHGIILKQMLGTKAPETSEVLEKLMDDVG